MITDEQRAVYEEILDVVIHDKGGVFFLSGFGGTGKTFIWSILSAAIRGLGKIVINTASSGIAALLLEGGRTAHSRFSFLMNPDETTSCKISPDSDLAKLLRLADLIVWDEAPMMSRHCQEMVYSSSDSIDPTDVDPSKVVEYSVEFLNSIRISVQGNKIQSTIPQDCVIFFVDEFQEYMWYSVKDFKLKTNVGRTRTTTNIFKLKFTVSTIMKKIPSVSISLYFYPANFADIIHRRLDFKTSVDVIGIVVNSTPLQFLLNEKTMINDLTFVSFCIEDDRYIYCY
ncbi:hypothetical protein Bca4012_083527 [Brassica carinata]